MSISVRDKTALCAALIGGPLFGFLATEFGGTAHRGVLVGATYVFLFIPAAVLLSKRLEILVWQASVISFGIYVLAWNVTVEKIDFAAGGAGLSFPLTAFLVWDASTIFSAPVPVYFCLRRIARPYRYYAAGGVTVVVVALFWLLKVFTA
jgi:hypothetical protein